MLSLTSAADVFFIELEPKTLIITTVAFLHQYNLVPHAHQIYSVCHTVIVIIITFNITEACVVVLFVLCTQ